MELKLLLIPVAVAIGITGLFLLPQLSEQVDLGGTVITKGMATWIFKNGTIVDQYAETTGGFAVAPTRINEFREYISGSPINARPYTITVEGYSELRTQYTLSNPSGLTDIFLNFNGSQVSNVVFEGGAGGSTWTYNNSTGVNELALTADVLNIHILYPPFGEITDPRDKPLNVTAVNEKGAIFEPSPTNNLTAQQIEEFTQLVEWLNPTDEEMDDIREALITNQTNLYEVLVKIEQGLISGRGDITNASRIYGGQYINANDFQDYLNDMDNATRHFYKQYDAKLGDPDWNG